MSESVTQLWRTVLSTLESDDRITPMLGGFLRIATPKGIMAGTLYLEVQNDMSRSMIEQRARTSLLDALKLLQRDDIETFAVTVNPDAETAAEPPESVPPLPDDFIGAVAASGDDRASAPLGESERVQHERPVEAATDVRDGYVHAAPSTNGHHPDLTVDADSRLNPKYTFDNFVIGGSNRFAHAAAFAVAEGPARAYNPLFIYGDSGLGKTHLLHAIGHYAKTMYPGIRVRYVSSEEFTNDFINSIADNQIQQFHARYRSIDILLIDDIQFLQGKDTTQETFFHTFNTLHEANKQVVITSDLPPKRLTGFEDRMRSRFEWGLITDVQSPDLETRIAILRKKAIAEGLTIPDDALEFIASRVTTSIRELEGTLIRVTAYANLYRQPVDQQLVSTVLRDLVTDDEPVVIVPSDIIRQTADYFRLTIDDLHGSSRSQAIATARQIAMYLCREMTGLSLPKIGQLFGGRDHTTVMYAHRKITKLISERRDVYNQVAELTARIRQDGASSRDARA